MAATVYKITDVSFLTMGARDAQRFETLLQSFGYRVRDYGDEPGTHAFVTRLENMPQKLVFKLLQAPWESGCVLWLWDETENMPEVHAFAARNFTITR
jgi:hypothetical protein